MVLSKDHGSLQPGGWPCIVQLKSAHTYSRTRYQNSLQNKNFQKEPKNRTVIDFIIWFNFELKYRLELPSSPGHTLNLQLCRLEMAPLLSKHYRKEGSLLTEEKKLFKSAVKLFFN